MHLLLLKRMSRREGSDTEHSRRNQCVSSKIYCNFNETPASYRTIPMNYGEIYIYTYISILRKPITLRWRTTVKDDSIHSPDCSLFFHFFSFLSSPLREESNCLITLISPEMPAFFWFLSFRSSRAVAPLSLFLSDTRCASEKIRGRDFYIGM